MKPRRTPSSLLGHLTQPSERERWPLKFSKDVTTSKGRDKFGGDGKPIKKSIKKRNFLLFSYLTSDFHLVNIEDIFLKFRKKPQNVFYGSVSISMDIF